MRLSRTYYTIFKLWIFSVYQKGIRIRRNKSRLTYSFKGRKKSEKREFVEKTWTNGLMFYLWVISWLKESGGKEEDCLYGGPGGRVGRKILNVREHSSLDYQTPYQHLKKHLPGVDKNIRFVIPIMLDKVSVQIGRWSGYNVLAQHHKKFHSFSLIFSFLYPFSAVP